VSGFTRAPDLHWSGNPYALPFTAIVAGHASESECIGSAFSPSPTGRGAVAGGADRPEHRWRGHTHGDVVAALSPDATAPLGSPSFLLSPDEAWAGTIVGAPDMVEADGTSWVVSSASRYNSPE